jgi:hypothetical protein
MNQEHYSATENVPIAHFLMIAPEMAETCSYPFTNHSPVSKTIPTDVYIGES